jgi:hypothetical protein
VLESSVHECSATECSVTECSVVLECSATKCSVKVWLTLLHHGRSMPSCKSEHGCYKGVARVLQRCYEWSDRVKLAAAIVEAMGELVTCRIIVEGLEGRGGG